MRKSLSILFLLSVILASGVLWAAPLRNHPNVITQPDGQTLHIFVTGDEYFRRMHDGRGYTIVQDLETGYFVYADRQGEILVPSRHVVGRVNPTELGLTPGLFPSHEYIEARYRALWSPTQTRRAPVNTKGKMNNIVIFIRFSDDSEFSTPASTYTSMLNSTASGANSLINYYKEVSYNQLTITSHFFPAHGSTVVSYQDTYARGYYRAYASTNTQGYRSCEESGEREHALLARAINAIKNSIPSNLNVDIDGDGKVDALAFVIRGQSDGWGCGLWSHQWKFSSQDVYINKARVQKYTFQMQDRAERTDGTAVFVHETFHLLGAPDLYRYKQDDDPVGPWDVMADSNGSPRHMSCYMKWRYGRWIASIPEITQNGTYTLNAPTSSSGQCYRIRTSQSTAEYFVLEYRRKTGTFESSLPASGIIVSRINPVAEGNAKGPPDEVYIFRPGGGPSQRGDLQSAAFSFPSLTSFANNSDPYPFLANGTRVNDVSVSNIGSAGGASISFSVGSVTADVQCRTCTKESDCGSENFCVGYENHPNQFCIRNCNTDNCPPDTQCEYNDSLGSYVCLPDWMSVYCSDQDLWLIDACHNHLIYLTCDTGKYCNEATFECDTACPAATCTSLDKECGSHSNNCGGVLQCGTCTQFPNSYCSPLGICTCGVNTCYSLGVECGSWPNGCGGEIRCGTCSGGDTCIDGACVVPTDGDTPDGDTPDGDRPDGDRPDGDRPDGDQPDADTSDGDDPEQELECRGLCEATDNPFCTVDGWGFCECNRGLWTRTDCGIVCRERRQTFKQCVFDLLVSVEGCVCDGEPQIDDNPEDDPGEDKNPDSGNSGQGGGGGGLCHSTGAGPIWLILVLFLWIGGKRTRIAA